jgi:hypothetical protein
LKEPELGNTAKSQIENWSSTVTNPPAKYSEEDPFSAFEQVAHQESSSTVLKYNKDEWTANDMPMDGNILTANMIDLCHGWRKWVDKKIVATDIGFIRNKFVPKQRNELDDHDETKWSVDRDGKPQDPWSWGYYLQLMDEEGSTFVWTASSAGARGAIGDLAKKYAKKRVNPIVKLSSSSYRHPQYGKVFVPVLEVEGWEEAAPPPLASGPASPLLPPTKEQPALAERIDDEIPF